MILHRVFLVVFASALLLGAALASAQSGDTGYLKTKVNPGRAGIFVDGKYVGPAANFGFARKYALPSGEHEVKLVEPRYQEFTTKVKIEAGKTFTLSQALQALPPAKPPFGQLRIIADEKYAAVFVNGKYMGHVDEFDGPNERLLLNPGEYTVKVVPMSGGPEHEEKVTLQADQLTVVNAKRK